MNIDRLTLRTDATIPLMAALPYRIEAGSHEKEAITYDPWTQLTRFARRDFSTCREDESAGGLFRSIPDTKKDD